MIENIPNHILRQMNFTNWIQLQQLSNNQFMLFAPWLIIFFAMFISLMMWMYYVDHKYPNPNPTVKVKVTKTITGTKAEVEAYLIKEALSENLYEKKD